MSFKAAIRVALLSSLMLGCIIPAQAGDSCNTRVRKAEGNFRKEIRKHGEHSAQAEYRRRQLEEARESCGYSDGFRGRKHHHDKHRDHGKRDHNHDYDRDHDQDRAVLTS
jgi:hypothetical protein